MFSWIPWCSGPDLKLFDTVHDLPSSAFLRAVLLFSLFLLHWFQRYSSIHCTKVSRQHAQHKLTLKRKYADTSFCSWYTFASLRTDSWEVLIKFKIFAGIPNRFLLEQRYCWSSHLVTTLLVILSVEWNQTLLTRSLKGTRYFVKFFQRKIKFRYLSSGT